MKKKIIIEIENKMNNGDVIVYKNGSYKSIEIHELLPDLMRAKQNIAILENKVAELELKVEVLVAKVKELRGEE